MVKNIEDQLVRARYDQAYAQFRQLCKDYPDYQVNANMFLTRYNELKNQVFSGILSSQEQHAAKLKIAAEFQICLMQFKQEYL
ncbi:MAG: hypothetical protein GY862_22490 [Gammaproteobacteria bacterium]|nr:hypothetical protein [Gammaproteobacteria bacterium]